jgi:hypothetical protein
VSVAQTELEALAPGMVRRIATVEGVQAVTAVASAAQLPCAPPDFARRVNEAFLELGPTRQALAAAITRIDDLVTETLSQTA